MIASKRDNLCMSILRSKYKVRQDWLFKESPKNASPTWGAIKSAKHTVIKGACYQVGDGTSTNVWSDLWVSWLPTFKPKPKNVASTSSHLWFLSSLTMLNMLENPIWFLSFSIMNQLRLSYPSLFL